MGFPQIFSFLLLWSRGDRRALSLWEILALHSLHGGVQVMWEKDGCPQNISDMLNQTASSFQQNLSMMAKSSLPGMNGGSALPPSHARDPVTDWCMRPWPVSLSRLQRWCPWWCCLFERDAGYCIAPCLKSTPACVNIICKQSCDSISSWDVCIR